MADIREHLPTTVLRQLADEGYHLVKIEGFEPGDYQPDTQPALQGAETEMSAKEWHELEERVKALEEKVFGKELPAEPPADHTAERQERADMFRRHPANAPSGTKPSGPRAA